MTWYFYLAHFLGGASLANAALHLSMGIARRPFPTPFASPPFRGPSSPAVNVGWAVANLVFAYLLLVRVYAVDLHHWRRVAVVAAGFVSMMVQVNRSLKRLRASAAE